MDYKEQLNEYILIWEFLNESKIDTEKLEVINYREGFNPYKHDWNYLIQLILKIRELGNNVEIGYKETIISWLYGDCTITKGTANTSIEAAYNACIVFIKDYNENNIGLHLLKLGWEKVNEFYILKLNKEDKLIYKTPKSHSTLYIYNDVYDTDFILAYKPSLTKIQAIVNALKQ